MTGALRASVQPADLPQVEYTGTLLQAAEVRTLSPEGQAGLVPVVCLLMELDTVVRTRMHIERPYAPHQRGLAEADARQLHKGMRVKVRMPMECIKLVARQACAITPLPCPAAAQQPTSINDLFEESAQP
jgi:hypothetical protein